MANLTDHVCLKHVELSEINIQANFMLTIYIWLSGAELRVNLFQSIGLPTPALFGVSGLLSEEEVYANATK